MVVFIEVDSVDEAIEKANDSEYTLMASLWTENVHTAFAIAPRLRAGQLFHSVSDCCVSHDMIINIGTININGHSLNSDGRLAGLGSVMEYHGSVSLLMFPT